MTLVSSDNYTTLKHWRLYSYVPRFIMLCPLVAYEGILVILHQDLTNNKLGFEEALRFCGEFGQIWVKVYIHLLKWVCTSCCRGCHYAIPGAVCRGLLDISTRVSIPAGGGRQPCAAVWYLHTPRQLPPPPRRQNPCTDTTRAQDKPVQCWLNAVPTSKTLEQHLTSIDTKFTFFTIVSSVSCAIKTHKW